MVKGVATFSGQKLTEARLAKGLYKNALADRIGVTAMQITRYEANQDRPTPEKLGSIAEVLEFPYEFFTRKSWPEPLGPIFWRSQVAETKTAREMTEQRMRWLCELFWTLEEELDFPRIDIPDLDVPDDFRQITPSMIEGFAECVRRDWRLKDLPIRDVVLSVENAGIPVVMLDILSEKQDGFFFRSSLLKRAFIGVNVHSVTAARARFDVAHELGHLILHKYVTSVQERDADLHKLLEQQAHRFAGAFLFPKDRFFEEVAVPTLDYFHALKKRWGMSIAAMISRSFDLGMIDKDARSQLFISMSRRKWRGQNREPFDSTMELERPRMLLRGVEALLDSGEYSIDFLEHLLSLPTNEINQLVGILGVGQKVRNPIMPDTSQKPAVRATDLETGKLISFPTRNRA
ncbi:ImmA/IrrE family metallo-endopeptidase [Agrobacterium vitis]|uniref:XRE family transcriptional regulator n=1 Tax=Agrobacterium vitis TaxID=373 RepID=UPI0012E80965|nr:XRE family transcriptional regulator [Agrobacterium vitis]MVA18955.1 ImmA/IrrE family metallo-endopeptidase [Agrobacterium vitis]